ncbi:MAG: bifunctional sugar-1-phosphate nucleotidylyltransferase/acetyltransferase [Thermoplasmatota archaeon]
MKALILAAGEGLRMGPLTENRPKPMLPVAGRPFLEHTVNALKKGGVDHIMILTGYRGIAIKEHFEDGSKFGVRIEYLIQPQRLGTAHAVSMAAELLHDPFICLNGDVIITEKMVKDLISKFDKEKKHLMSLIKVEDSSRFGLVIVEDGNVLDIIEKSGEKRPGLVNGGIYIFKPDIFQLIKETPLSPRGEYEITNTIQLAIRNEGVKAFVPGEKWVDIGSPWDLLNAHEIFMEKQTPNIQGTVEDNVQIHGNVVLKKGAVIKSGTYIEGNVFIDEDATIGPNSYIRGATYIGKGAKVGAASEVKNSIILDRSHVPHHNYVGDSIIGSNCNLGSGTKVANLRLDDGNVPVVLKGKKVDSGRRKLGVIMGDDVKTGINASIDPGTIIYSGTRIGPGTNASGSIGKDSKVH